MNSNIPIVKEIIDNMKKHRYGTVPLK